LERAAAMLVGMAQADSTVKSGRDHADLPNEAEALLTQARAAGLAAGLSAVETIAAQTLEPARSVLGQRKAAGLAGSMQFTYRNPNRSTDPWASLPSAQSMLVALQTYRGSTGDSEPCSGLVGRQARYAADETYAQLRAGLEAMAGELRRAGHKAVVVADSNALVDRNGAWLAGLGWYGKNTNLLNRDLGSWFVIGAVITNAPLPRLFRPVLPADDGCGSCTLCIEACPTEALVAPGVLDASACISWMVQAAEPIPLALRSAVGDRLYGCDICQEVCPPSRVALGNMAQPDSSHRTTDATAGAEAHDEIDLEWILTASDDELLAELKSWYIANRDPNVIRRTALVVLGNVGHCDLDRALVLLEPYLTHPEPLIAEHAHWAMKQLKPTYVSGGGENQ